MAVRGINVNPSPSFREGHPLLLSPFCDPLCVLLVVFHLPSQSSPPFPLRDSTWCFLIYTGDHIIELLLVWEG